MLELKGKNSWFSAIEKREYDHVRANLEQYAGSVNEEGHTGLMRAVIMNDDDMARILVQNEYGKRDARGYTALMIAAELNKSKLCRRLVHFEGDLTGGSDDFTALMIAAMSGSYEAVMVLSPYLKDKYSKINRNALSYAAERGNLDCVKFLMSRESHEDMGPGSPLKYAAENGHAEVAAVLAQFAKDDDETVSQSLTNLSLAQSQGVAQSYDICAMIKAIDISRKGMENFGSEATKVMKTSYECELERKLEKYSDMLNAANSHADLVIAESAAMRARITQLEEALTRGKSELDHLTCELEDYKARLTDAEMLLETGERTNLILSMADSKNV
ncbi:Ankyrin repeat protein 1 [Giardia duodenalis]|uniref:Ankyrin repeat protein 1 n=2 Tax=Giardia intestinalis TaxID=5741 RepID=A8BXV9_GIAIC|nr:Ankyrin repeat protein 1 [Giardia intestinalis]ESU35308.1 Hypothetical protein DHA2_9030 [Giardia intestinalis]KAE8304803.1 Ankyrin repeat protein 1 [Giardia intestinalis]|eukprot:XP_001704232.1 Protein 21.1 [Giardia lamblia ATCC 50803]